MTQIKICFLLSIPDEGDINHECFVCDVPKKGDIIFLEKISGKPYASAIAKVEKIALVVNLEQTTTFYAVDLRLVKTMPIDVPFEIIRRM